MYGEAIQILQANRSGGKEGRVDNLWGPQTADLENSLPDLPFQEGEHVLLPVHQKTGQEFPTTKKQR